MARMRTPPYLAASGEAVVADGTVVVGDGALVVATGAVVDAGAVVVGVASLPQAVSANMAMVMIAIRINSPFFICCSFRIRLLGRLPNLYYLERFPLLNGVSFLGR